VVSDRTVTDSRASIVGRIVYPRYWLIQQIHKSSRLCRSANYEMHRGAEGRKQAFHHAVDAHGEKIEVGAFATDYLEVPAVLYEFDELGHGDAADVGTEQLRRWWLLSQEQGRAIMPGRQIGAADNRDASDFQNPTDFAEKPEQFLEMLDDLIRDHDINGCVGQWNCFSFDINVKCLYIVATALFDHQRLALDPEKFNVPFSKRLPNCQQITATAHANIE